MTAPAGAAYRPRWGDSRSEGRLIRHLLVPVDATSTRATIWIGVVSTVAPPPLTLEVGDAVPRPIDGGWSTWQTHGQTRLSSQRITLEGLAPGRRHPVHLLEEGTVRATAVAVTLPDRLPGIDERPFICLVGSCFAHANDADGAAGAAYARLPTGGRPDVKFLCGDQVYLDAPWQKYLVNVYGDEDLKAQLLATYHATWTQGGDGRGFHEILRDGATFFSSDDHELWNNAPNKTATVRQTWWPLGDGGRSWLRTATALYDLFQTPSRSASFRVGPLSFRVLDTRMARTADTSAFAASEELSALRAWVEALPGPGVLVLGQPVLVERTGIKGRFFDRSLADFDQYAELVRILHAARHDVLVVTGDVHFGRVAGCALASGASLIEVIASPFELVDAAVGGTWRPPPGLFPAFAVPGVARSTVWVDAGHRLTANHFATLEFSAHGSRTKMAVKAWPIPVTAQAPAPTVVYRHELS